MTSIFGTEVPNYLFAVIGGIILLLVLQRLPVIGGVIRLLVSCAIIGLVAMVVLERASIDPVLAPLASRFNLDRQEVVGSEVRIRMASDGHFWANVSMNGAKRRMLIDSGATMTAISERTASAAAVAPEADLVPVVLRTANGMVPAKTARVPELRLGNIVARDLKVVVSPAFGEMDVIGMNFLSKLKSWRVEDGTLVMVPHHPQPVSADGA
ncbi:MAG: TIGR02281 family clan AA aspartic protease [Pseudomonadota bacterium]|nr:TIGR02281 family clan AA aspartic protease [Pseudomonadota bacterium]